MYTKASLRIFDTFIFNDSNNNNDSKTYHNIISLSR